MKKEEINAFISKHKLTYANANVTNKRKPAAHFTHLFFTQCFIPTQKNKRVKLSQPSSQ